LPTAVVIFVRKIIILGANWPFLERGLLYQSTSTTKKTAEESEDDGRRV